MYYLQRWRNIEGNAIKEFLTTDLVPERGGRKRTLTF